MLTWTNMARPGDVYRTGQQLYRRPPGLLAAFAAGGELRAAGRRRPACCVMVYQPLHRTRPVAVTAGTLAFGFRAAGIAQGNETPALAAVADLDLMQARRHAAALAGHAPRDDLTALQTAAAGPVRGLAAARQAWAGRRKPARGMALMVDTARDLPGGPALAGVCEQAHGILPAARASSAGLAQPCGELSVGATMAQALAIALACARYLGRYQWDGTLDITQIMAAHAWDCLPGPADAPARGVPALAEAGMSRHAAAPGQVHAHQH
jgi:hypothetical protein